MKILAIRLENLASLAGFHEIDFTLAPLADQGLFAITGPTGAGKSTLLDALCLALYGNTPRLRHAPGRDSQLSDVGDATLATADARTLLRRGCANGFAEVDFVGRDQRRYRARWAVRRARDRHDGRLQAAEQSLTDLDEQRLLTAQKREFDRLLPERLGLNFDQFTRAVLLAQSEFAAFLTADDNARSELLEKLTATGEYSQISMAAYRRARDAQQTVRELDQRLAGAAPADAEQRTQLENEATHSERALAETQAQAARLQAERQWLQQDRRLSQALNEARQRHSQAQHDSEALADTRQRERQLELLAPQRHRFTRIATLERQYDEHQQRLTTTQQALIAAEGEHTHAANAQARAENALAQAGNARQAAQPLIETARECATQLDHLERSRREKQISRQQIDEALVADRQRHAQAQHAQTQQQRQCDELEASLGEQLGEYGDALATRRALQAREDQAGQMRLMLQTLEQHWRQWRDGERHLNELREQHDDDERQQARVLEGGRGAAAEFERLSGEQKRLKASIDRLQAARSESVVQLRQQLTDDQPCPVCGGLEHPYRQSPPAEPAQTMLDATEREEQRQLADAEQAVDAARERHHHLQGEYRALQARLKQAAPAIARLADDVATQHARLLEQAEGALLLEHEDQAETWLAEQRESVERQWQQSRQALETLESIQQRLAPLRQTLQKHEIELGRLASRCEQHGQLLESLDAELAPLGERCERLDAQLRRSLGEHANPSAWQIAVDAGLETAREAAQRAKTQTQQRESAAQQQRQTLTHLQSGLETLRQERSELRETLDAWRRENPEFTDTTLDELLAVNDDERQRQRQRLQASERESHAAEVSLDERQRALIDHRHERFDDSNDIDARIDTLAERIEAEQAALEQQCEATQQRRDVAIHALRDDDQCRKHQRELLDELERARHEQHRWGSISELIGSADGKAFRRIAQAYNLEQLLDHANAHLATLSRRYRLVRGGSELGMLVIDGDMGDERRSVHSLSGGETFLVSLALALGLASMASGQLRIESLFIDEGFGSLDPQSLALAMDALDGLQSQGRRVGVISHVQEMHERIALQIRVEPAGNGASRVSVAIR